MRALQEFLMHKLFAAACDVAGVLALALTLARDLLWQRRLEKRRRQNERAYHGWSLVRRLEASDDGLLMAHSEIVNLRTGKRWHLQRRSEPLARLYRVEELNN